MNLDPANTSGHSGSAPEWPRDCHEIVESSVPSPETVSGTQQTKRILRTRASAEFSGNLAVLVTMIVAVAISVRAVGRIADSTVVVSAVARPE